MYCEKCGSLLSAGDRFCPACGAPARAPEPGGNTASGERGNGVNGYDDVTVSANDAAVPNIYGGAAQGYGENNRAPGFDKVSAVNSRSRKVIVRLIAALAAIIIALAAGLGVYTLVVSSDWFRLAKAEKAILEGKYDSGLSKISGVNSERADAVRGFTEVLKIRDSLKNSFGSNDVAGFDSDAYGYAKDFKEELTRFAKDYEPMELTEKLSGLYKDYSAAAADVAKLLYDSGVSGRFVTAQVSIKEYDSRKHGSRFTTDALEKLADETETAYGYIRDKLTETKEYKDFTEEFDGRAENIMTEFMNSVSAQIEQDRYEIDRFGSEYRGRVIHYDETDSSHKAYVADGLDYAGSDESIKRNAEKLIATLDCAMLLNSF